MNLQRFPVVTRSDFYGFAERFRQSGIRRATSLLVFAMCGRTNLAALLGFARCPKTGSYMDQTYHGVNTFLWKCKVGEPAIPVRYRAVVTCRGEQAPSVLRSPRMLDTDLEWRLTQSSLKLTLEFVAGDRLRARRRTDPTRAWPGWLPAYEIGND